MPSGIQIRNSIPPSTNESAEVPHRHARQAERLVVGALLVVCFFLYFVGLDNFPFIDPSEAYYVEACREMLQMGDYITPHLNYQIYFSKPILNFWLIAASYKLFGLSEFSARLPFAILSTGLVLATFWFTRRLLSVRAGAIAGICLATSPLLLLVSRKSSVDIAFTFFLNVAVFSTALAISKRSRWAWFAVYVALGLGVLTKGPATLLLYGVGMAAFLVVARPSWENIKNWIAALKPIAGFFIFLAVVLPWHIAVSLATGGLFLKVFFWYENLARFNGHTNLAEVRYWFFFSVLGYGFAPWVVLLPPAIYHALIGERATGDEPAPTLAERARHASPLQESNGTGGSAASLGARASLPASMAANFPLIGKLLALAACIKHRADTDNVARALILICAWSVTTFAFFSASRTQLATYILPVLAPASVLIAALVEHWLNKGYDSLSVVSRRWMTTFSWIFAIIGIAMIPASIVFAVKFHDASWAVRGPVILAAALFSIGAVKQLLALRARQLARSVTLTGAATVIMLAIATPISFHIGVQKTQGAVKDLATRAGKSDDKIAMFGNYMPSSMFYSKKPVDTFFHGHQLVPARKPPAGHHKHYPYVPQSILVRDSELPALKNSAPCELVLVEKLDNWCWYRTPGYELESVKTLEDTFRDPVAFNIIVTGQSPTGPLTVPYAAGKLYEKYSR